MLLRSEGKKHILIETVWNPQEIYHHFVLFAYYTDEMFPNVCLYVIMHLSCVLTNHKDSLLLSPELSCCWNKIIRPSIPNESYSF